jgi:hypothetical protein
MTGLAQLFPDQFGNFPLIWEPLPLCVVLGVNQHTVVLNVEYATASLDQLNMRTRISCLQFCFHPGSMGKVVSGNAVLNEDLHMHPPL